MRWATTRTNRSLHNHPKAPRRPMPMPMHIAPMGTAFVPESSLSSPLALARYDVARCDVQVEFAQRRKLQISCRGPPARRSLPPPAWLNIAYIPYGRVRPSTAELARARMVCMVCMALFVWPLTARIAHPAAERQKETGSHPLCGSREPVVPARQSLLCDRSCAIPFHSRTLQLSDRRTPVERLRR